MLEPELAPRLAGPAREVLAVRGRGPRLVAPEDLHLTLAFAGPLTEAEAREFDAQLALCLFEASAPALVLDGPDALPRPGKERVLIATVRERSAGRLAELVERVGEAAELAGVELPDAGRPFLPHVTLARVPVDRHGSRARVPAEFYGMNFGLEWTPTRAAWVESVGGGEPYRVAGEYPLVP